PTACSASTKCKDLAKQVDIIHYHVPSPYADLLQTICRLTKPYIVTYHSDSIQQTRLMLVYTPWLSRFVNGAKYMLPASPN
ncbi:glycosyl transferase, partial [Francisella tularensis subsp. holarctica]|nr:glycosyl transferase [Francisella tularensis subsp. holarctica]